MRRLYYFTKMNEFIYFFRQNNHKTYICIYIFSFEISILLHSLSSNISTSAQLSAFYSIFIEYINEIFYTLSIRKKIKLIRE